MEKDEILYIFKSTEREYYRVLPLIIVDIITNSVYVLCIYAGSSECCNNLDLCIIFNSWRSI